MNQIALQDWPVVYRAVERYPNDLMMAYSTADIRRAKKQNKIAALMGIEGGHAIEDSLMALREFYRLGIRYMTLTHNACVSGWPSRGPCVSASYLSEVALVALVFWPSKHNDSPAPWRSMSVSGRSRARWPFNCINSQ